MRDSHPHPIDSLFSVPTKTECVSLSKIKQQAIMLLNLNRVVNTILPAPLRHWCRVANIRQGVLVLETANACWQIRLRYEQPQLLSSLRTIILPSLSSINIRINPSLANKQKLNEQNNGSCQQYQQPIRGQLQHLSVRSAAYIRHLAARSEGKLKNALEQLAELAGENPSSASCKRRSTSNFPE